MVPLSYPLYDFATKLLDMGCHKVYADVSRTNDRSLISIMLSCYVSSNFFSIMADFVTSTICCELMDMQAISPTTILY